MTNKKHTGSYYTPPKMADFIIKHINNQLCDRRNISILEPSVGDGSFIHSCTEILQDKIASITAIDINEKELNKSKSILVNPDIPNNFICKDFLFCDYSDIENNYDLIIGNPPYIKKSLLSEDQLEKCREIHDSFNLSKKSINNIWTSFLLKSISLLSDNGTLALVLPAELLQVKFAQELRNLIKDNFQRTEIFTFTNLLFECKGQDTIILIGYSKSQNPGLFFSNIENIDFEEEISLKQNIFLTDNNVKWNHHTLTSDDLEFLYTLKNNYHKVDYYSDSKPGIVSAANDYFIVNQEIEEKYNLGTYTKPIIQRGLFVNGSILFTDDNYNKLVEEGKPAKILCFKDDDKLSKKVLEYLEIGESRKIPDGYKCSIRNKWYVIPNISEPPEAFFFKRSHNYPKLIKNDAGVLVTDSGYKISMLDGYSINDFIYSFYNSLTLIFAEMEGRYYGGGVLELTPSEFKCLPLPLVHISEEKFDFFTSIFENKENIEDVLDYTDQSILNLNSEEIFKLRHIRRKLMNKRLK